MAQRPSDLGRSDRPGSAGDGHQSATDAGAGL